eukprot:749473-Pelagomonas_calceolata.AAC.1
MRTATLKIQCDLSPLLRERGRKHMFMLLKLFAVLNACRSIKGSTLMPMQALLRERSLQEHLREHSYAHASTLEVEGVE